MPTVIASFSDFGIDTESTRAIGVNAAIAKIIPEMKTAANASCQVNPSVWTAVYVKNAFTPIPGTRIAGAFAQNAMSRHPTNELKTVAKIPASRGMPASDKMDAFTIIIYTIVKNDVTPAKTSCFGDVSCKPNLNVLSSIPFMLNLLFHIPLPPVISLS
ncbi:Uncharacterised protein [Streptococcus pneumoniae]|nr:Uncharacterised protein [Bacillus paranthracis]CKG08362.1 Uncharacterised protein [Streptococcus pneumoniae]